MTGPDYGPETPGYEGIDGNGHPVYAERARGRITARQRREDREDARAGASHPIALELLEREAERLRRDHYDNKPYSNDADWIDDVSTSCSECGRAYRVRLEIERLSK